jgi:hypothetical protein
MYDDKRDATADRPVPSSQTPERSVAEAFARVSEISLTVREDQHSLCINHCGLCLGT